eukprot:1769681-Amphidinium_carterae.1
MAECEPFAKLILPRHPTSNPETLRCHSQQGWLLQTRAQLPKASTVMPRVARQVASSGKDSTTSEGHCLGLVSMLVMWRAVSSTQARVEEGQPRKPSPSRPGAVLEHRGAAREGLVSVFNQLFFFFFCTICGDLTTLRNR